MLPTKLAYETALAGKLCKASKEPETAERVLRDAIADFQSQAAAGGTVEECTIILKAWFLTGTQEWSKISANKGIKFNKKQKQVIEIIHRMTLAQLNGQVINVLSEIIGGNGSAKDRTEATKALHEILNGGEAKGDAKKTAQLIIELTGVESGN